MPFRLERSSGISSAGVSEPFVETDPILYFYPSSAWLDLWDRLLKKERISFFLSSKFNSQFAMSS